MYEDRESRSEADAFGRFCGNRLSFAPGICDAYEEGIGEIIELKFDCLTIS
jgi:hypothetical protein